MSNRTKYPIFVLSVAPKIIEVVLKAFRRCEDFDQDEEEIVSSLKAGTAMLLFSEGAWAVVEITRRENVEGTFKPSTAWVRYMATPQGLTRLFPPEHTRDFLPDVVNQLERWAKDQGLARLVWYGRPGWHRHLRGYRQNVCYTKHL